MKTDQEKIAVMQAHLRGEKIECMARIRGGYQWELAAMPLWDWRSSDYRIAPREPRRVWLSRYSDGTFGQAFASKATAVEQSIGFGNYRGEVIEFLEVLP